MEKYIYVINIENTDIYKIGISKYHPSLRIKQIQTGNPFKLSIQKFYLTDKANLLEKILHRRFASKKVIEDDFLALKGEWFKLTPEDILSFEEKCNKIIENIDFVKKNSTYQNKF